MQSIFVVDFFAARPGVEYAKNSHIQMANLIASKNMTIALPYVSINSRAEHSSDKNMDHRNRGRG